ncbi:MAG TPA: cupin domain-containing protein [Alphaproteobacteria bacterium]|nr:cupin domain-containing protein [Alphaproteobacteria bacterium]
MNISYFAIPVVLLGSIVLGTAIAEPIVEKALAFTPVASELKWGPCPAIFPAGCEIAVLHGDPAAPNADVFLKVSAKTELPPHWHTSAERMILVSGELHVSYQGQPTVILTPGSYAYGPAKLPHKVVCVSSDACTLFIAFESPVDAQPFDGPL